MVYLSVSPFYLYLVGSRLMASQLLGLLGLLLFRCTRRRRRQQHHRDSASSFAAGDAGAGATGGVLGGFFASNRDSHGRNTSEKGFLQGSHYAAAASSPTMGGDTYYSGSGGKGSVESAAMLGTGAGVGGLAAGAAPGERTSGVVLPRVKDENQSGDRWIETGAEVSVLWP